MLVAAEVVPAFVLGFEEHRLQSAADGLTLGAK